MGKKKHKKTKYSKLLTPEQKHQYDLFGKPDLTQNWLEIFSPNVMSDLKTIMHCCSDNQKKSDYVSSELAEFGFQDVGLGTNILTMSNPYYPGVVFKIALDDFGIADNFNDCVLCEYVPKYNRVFARDPSAMVSVQERCVKPTAQQMDILEPRILELLQELRKHFLIADLSVDNFLNYGITREGDFRIIDGSDLYPLSQMSKAPTCRRIIGEHRHTGELKYCEGKLHYTSDYKWLKCDKCGKEILPLEARPRKDVSKMSDYFRDGFTLEERTRMASEEIAVIRAAHPELYPEEAQDSDETDTRQEPRTIFVYPDSKSEVSSDQADETDEEDVEDELGDEPDEFGFNQLHRISKSSDEDEEDSDPDPEEDHGGVPNDSHSSGRAFSLAVNDGPVRTTGESAPVDNELSLEDLLNNGDDTVVTRAVGMLSTKLISALHNMRTADNEIVQEAFLDVISTALGIDSDDLGRYLSSYGDDAEDTDREDDCNTTEEQMDEDPAVVTVESTIDYIRGLKSSSDPADARALLQIEALFDSSTRVETENTNSDIRGDDSDENSDPHITYRLIKDVEGDANAIPSIELSIHGDPDEAYDESGMPITITLDNGGTVYVAATAYQIKDLIQHAIDDAQADMVEYLRLDAPPSDDADEEQDQESE